MELAEVGSVYIFKLPIATSLLATICQQLWVVGELSPNITNLMTANLIHCKRIDRQPLTYLSAVSHQLLKPVQSATSSSPPAHGTYLLKQLTTASQTEPTAQWQGVVNDQGYLYLQPTTKAIAAWLNHLLNIKNSEINGEFLTKTAASITLQYSYTRCTQLLDLFPLAPLTCQEITTNNLATTPPIKLELIGAIADIWDHLVARPENHQRIPALSRQLVAKFLEVEKNCCFGHQKNQSTTNLDYGLLTIVQMTIKMILQKYWNLEPLSHW